MSDLAWFGLVVSNTTNWMGVISVKFSVLSNSCLALLLGLLQATEFFGIHTYSQDPGTGMAHCRFCSNVVPCCVTDYVIFMSYILSSTIALGQPMNARDFLSYCSFKKSNVV